MDTSVVNGDDIDSLNIITQNVETSNINDGDDESQGNFVDIDGHISPMTDQSSVLCQSQIYYENNDHDITVLMAMAIGLSDVNGKIYDGCRDDDRFPTKKKKNWYPSNGRLVKEINRRKRLINDLSVTNQQTKRQDAIDWLLTNPLMVAEDVLFVKGQMSDIIQTVKCAEKEKEEMKRHSNWTGTIPHLLLIHCIVDDDNIKLLIFSV